MKVFRYILREIKNLFEFYLIPLLAVVLPHRIYYPFFKFVCSYTFFYKKYSENSYQNANKIVSYSNGESLWKRNVKLLYLIDFTDYWLARFRPKKLLKLLKKEGNWEQCGGYIGLSLHFGPGYVSLLDLKNNRFNPFFVYSEPIVDFQFQSYIERKYRKSRMEQIDKISGSLAITTGGGYDKIIQVVRNQGIPIILFDAPQFDKTKKYMLNVFDKKYKVASGFVNLICQEAIKFQLYTVKINFSDGTRLMKINKLSQVKSSDSLLETLSLFFERSLESSPEQWYLWRQSKGLFEVDYE